MRNPLRLFSLVVALVGVAVTPLALSSCSGDDSSPPPEGTGGATDDGGPDGTDDVSQGDAGGDASGGDAADVSQGEDGSDGALPDGAGVDVKPDCELAGATCTAHSDCCSANCDPDTHICANSVGQCKAAGEGCAAATECCTTVCQSGVCGASVCISDNEPCADDSECCGGVCGTADGGSVCVPLNPDCSTTGNACAADDDCCSQLCTNGRCSESPSFCTQTGDACASNAACCTGICSIQAGATIGTCVEASAPGTTGCLLAGEVCGGTAVADGGLPSCGGDCCSRSCAPWGPSGVFVCQPPSGCRPTGEACRDDGDCCGSPGMPGGNGSVHCSKANGEPVGRCDNGGACRAAGAVCKLATSSCNAENNCCAGNVNTDPTVCQQDLLGIPRCTGVGDCADAGDLSGQACATSADCCGLPCVPNQDPSGPPFVCGASCVPEGGACTTDADCCAGIPCILQPGSTQGTCGGTLDGGVTDGAVPDAPVADAPVVDAPSDAPPADAGVPDSTTCALYGQECTTTADCCNGIPCTEGRCRFSVY